MTADDIVLALLRCLPLSQPESELFSPAVLVPTIESEAEAYAVTDSERAFVFKQNSFDGAERPATMPTPSLSAPFTPPVKKEVPLPAGWVEVQTLGGKTYYYNKELKTTAWSVETIERMRAQKQELCAGTKAEDAKAPDTQAAATVTSDDPSCPGMQAVQEVVPLPAGWVERHTLGGRAYYYNEELRTTAMKRPTSAKAR